MNKSQLLVRLAAKSGELDKIDPALLIPENVLSWHPHPKPGLFISLPEQDGPIQDAAAHGQLAFLPREARTVPSLVYCGMNRWDHHRVCNDAFFAAAMAGTLDKFPQDREFRNGLLYWKTGIEANLKRAASSLREMSKEKPGDVPSLRSRIDAVRQWWERAYENEAPAAFLTDGRAARYDSPIDLPDVPSVPKISPTTEQSNVARGGK